MGRCQGLFQPRTLRIVLGGSLFTYLMFAAFPFLAAFAIAIGWTLGWLTLLLLKKNAPVPPCLGFKMRRELKILYGVSAVSGLIAAFLLN